MMNLLCCSCTNALLMLDVSMLKHICESLRPPKDAFYYDKTHTNVDAVMYFQSYFGHLIQV